MYGQSLLNRKISVHLDSINIEQALAIITKKSNVAFSYSKDLIPLNKKVSLHLKNNSLDQILTSLFVDTRIIYKKIGNQITLRRKAKINKLILTKKGGMLLSQIQPIKLTQTIRGTVIDQDSKAPLVGATVWINDQLNLGTSTDIKGRFEIQDVPIGRHKINAAYLGYKSFNIPKVKVISGKELVLDIELEESTLNLPLVEIDGKTDLTASINTMAVSSARSLSVDETKRYAASAYDPARMVMSFAGVSTTGSDDDMANELSIRGNSPRSNIWRLEGVDIPNPNHYSSLGSSGGSISMLSSNILTHSDFYTGGFPAEFGNAIGGVFDLRMRTGNEEKQEFSVMFGNIGMEASIEGPIGKNTKASYLFNYRYTTLQLLTEIGIRPIQNEDAPRFQDLSFKIHVPTKKLGIFSLFGLGGSSLSIRSPKKDSTMWKEEFDRFGYDEEQTLGIIGLSHRLLLSDNSYLHTVFSGSRLKDLQQTYFLEADYAPRSLDRGELKNRRYNLTTSYTNKISARNTLRAGITYSHRNFELQIEELNGYPDPNNAWGYFNNRGKNNLVQSFLHWKFRISDRWTINSGIRASYFQLSKSHSIEPRLGLEWSIDSKQKITATAGVYSELPHEAFYLVEGITAVGDSIFPSTRLKMTKSLHLIGGYNLRFSERFRLKAEMYYQHIYHVPVVSNFGQTASSVNASDVWDLLGPFEWSNIGKARNYGIDLTLERFFSRQYYFLLTGSLFSSRFTPFNGKEYSTRFDSNFRINLLAGKEFSIGKSNNKTFGINGKMIIEGGKRINPIDLESSKEFGFTFHYPNEIFSSKLPIYHRIDLGVSYQINQKDQTHTFSLNIQNLTNRENAFDQVYNSNTESIVNIFHRGFLPILNYRLDF